MPAIIRDQIIHTNLMTVPTGQFLLNGSSFTFWGFWEVFCFGLFFLHWCKYLCKMQDREESGPTVSKLWCRYAPSSPCQPLRKIVDESCRQCNYLICHHLSCFLLLKNYTKHKKLSCDVDCNNPGCFLSEFSISWYLTFLLLEQLFLICSFTWQEMDALSSQSLSSTTLPM